MTNKTTMPDPVAWVTRNKTIGPEYGKERYGKLPIQSLNPLTYEHEPLITIDQAEAYANQRVKQALEEAFIEVMRCKTSGIIRNDTVDKCADAIRALIPKEPPCDTC